MVKIVVHFDIFSMLKRPSAMENVLENNLKGQIDPW